jgi:RNA polymerase sigma factor (sigma-70 family)
VSQTAVPVVADDRPGDRRRSVDAAGPSLGRLVEQAAAGDDTAWRALVERFGPMVWSITRAHNLFGSDAADVSQTVWLRLVDNLGRLREPDRVGAWLAATTRHECIRVSSLRRRSVPMGEPEVFDRLDPVVNDDPAVRLTRQDRDAAVRAVVATMPERSQTLLSMLMADPPMPYEQVAAGLGIPIGSIGPTRQRCLRVLRAKCVSAGIEP